MRQPDLCDVCGAEIASGTGVMLSPVARIDGILWYEVHKNCLRIAFMYRYQQVFRESVNEAKRRSWMQEIIRGWMR